MTDATAAIATSLAATQLQTSLLAVRLASESQRQISDLLAENVQAIANPEHLGNRVDTLA
jgi:hypothetical protein